MFEINSPCQNIWSNFKCPSGWMWWLVKEKIMLCSFISQEYNSIFWSTFKLFISVHCHIRISSILMKNWLRWAERERSRNVNTLVESLKNCILCRVCIGEIISFRINTMWNSLASEGQGSLACCSPWGSQRVGYDLSNWTTATTT